MLFNIYNLYINFIDEDKITDTTGIKSIKMTNKLDTISEKSLTKDDDTEIEQVQIKFNVYLEKVDESSL